MAKAAVLALLALPVVLAACASVPSPPPPPSPTASALPNFSFAHDFGNCSAGPAPFVVKANPREVRIAGEAQVPNPCQKLSAWPLIIPGEVVLDITRKPSADTCIQCVGAIPFAARVGSLEPGVTRIRTLLDGTEIYRTTLYVPRPDDPAPICAGLATGQCPAGLRCIPTATYSVKTEIGGYCLP